MDQSTLGRLIRTLRHQNHMTQAQLAARVGVTDKAVSKWERGLSYPDIALFPVLAETLGVTISNLLDGCSADSRSSGLLQVFALSHDIRTPLHIILGCADMARTYKDDPGRVRRCLDNITISGEYLLGVIDHVLQTDQRIRSELKEAAQLSGAAVLDRYLKEDPMCTMGYASESLHDFSGRRFLVAEDMEINREIAAETLKRSGAEVEFAEDGSICCDMVSSAPPGYYDLILMDILMPNMDGIEATRRIRQLRNSRKASIPIIAMTANVCDEDRDAAFSAGMNAFTEKPISVSRLFDTIQEQLDAAAE